MGSFVAIRVLLLMGILSTNQLIETSYIWEGLRHKKQRPCYHHHTVLVLGGRGYGEEAGKMREPERQKDKIEGKQLRNVGFCVCYSIVSAVHSLRLNLGPMEY